MITITRVLCLVDWCLTKSLWINFQISQNKQWIQWRRIYFPKYKMIEYNCTKNLCMIIHEKNHWWRKTIRSHHFIEKEKLGKYLSGILSIDIDEADIENKNQFINDIRGFNNKHILQCNNKTISNIPEEWCYISSMTPTAFMNDQDESRCYANSSFQVLFLNIFFRQVIMNIDCEKNIEHMDNIKDEYRGYIHNIMIP